MPKMQATVFHTNGKFNHRQLKELNWSYDTLEKFSPFFEHAPRRPDSIFLNFFSNALEKIDFLWWRSVAKEIAPEHWYLAALGYLRAMQWDKAEQMLCIDAWERDLESDNFVEAFQLSKQLQKERPHLWLLWSKSLLKDWQEEGIGEAAERVDYIQSYFEAQDVNTIFLSVTDPLGAIIAAKEFEKNLDRTRVFVLPEFVEDRLLAENWYMQTASRFQQAMEELK